MYMISIWAHSVVFYMTRLPDDIGHVCTGGDQTICSIARSCWRTGTALKLERARTDNVDWFVYKNNFDYMYCRARDRTWVSKRALRCEPLPDNFNLPLWQILNAETPEQLLEMEHSDLDILESNDIEISVDADGIFKGRVCDIEVPSPVLRHCLGHFPLPSFLKPQVRKISGVGWTQKLCPRDRLGCMIMHVTRDEPCGMPINSETRHLYVVHKCKGGKMYLLLVQHI